MAFESVSEQVLKRERAKARDIRLSAWWRNQIGRGQCHYCQRTIHPDELTMDHKTPIARGGMSTRQNLVACCKECNNEKKYLTLAEWIAQRQTAGQPLPCAAIDLY